MRVFSCFFFCLLAFGQFCVFCCLSWHFTRGGKWTDGYKSEMFKQPGCFSVKTRTLRCSTQILYLGAGTPAWQRQSTFPHGQGIVASVWPSLRFCDWLPNCLFLCKVLACQDEYREAIQMLRKALKMEPSNKVLFASSKFLTKFKILRNGQRVAPQGKHHSSAYVGQGQVGCWFIF